MNESVVVPCAACGTLNRVPRARLRDVAVCRDCRGHLLDGPPAELTDATFERFTTKCDLPVVVDFWAPWCGPCLRMAPDFAEAAAALAGTARLAKLDTQAHGEIPGRLGIQGIPTMILFDHGREVARRTGALQAAAIAAWVRAHVPG
ncbi:MAG: thioredoxin TrxC [Planctomycetota bacterium]